MKKDIYVIICGGGSYNDLGLIRSCGEAGLKVIYITENIPVYPIYKSKYLIKTIYIKLTESIFINTIIELVEKYTNITVLPASDICALFLDKNYMFLKNKCKIPNAQGNLAKLMDKEYMVNLANSCGFLVPFSKKFNLIEDCDFSNIEYPCIIKPLKSILGEKSDIAICESEDNLYKTINCYRHKKHYDILVQKFITDNKKKEIAIPGVRLENGDIYIKGEIQKERMFGNGNTVFGKYNVQIKRKEYCLVKDFLDKSNFVGIFDIEFLKTEKGLYFIECNYRNGAYGYAVTKSGFNMPECFILEDYVPLKMKNKVFMEERSDFLNVLNKKIRFTHWVYNLLRTDVFLFFNFQDISTSLRIPHFIKKIFK